MRFVEGSDYIWRSDVIEMPMENDIPTEYKYLKYNDKENSKPVWESGKGEDRKFYPSKCCQDSITTIKDDKFTKYKDPPT